MMRKYAALLLALLMLAVAPPAHAQFAAQATWGGTSGGTANAQTLAIPNAVDILDLVGVPLSFVPGLANTSATTLIVGPLSGIAVRKPTPSGITALTGGEFVVGQLTVVVFDGTFFQIANGPPAQVPTYTLLTSGSGATYTTPTGARQLYIVMVGGGGGGAAGTGGAGSNGVITVFNSVQADAGLGASGNAGGAPGAAGTGSALRRLTGTRGGSGVPSNVASANMAVPGGAGGASTLGGPGISNATGGSRDAVANSGSGGAGGSRNGTVANDYSGGGGGSGETVTLVINSPAASYTYTVGTGGAGGTGGATTGGAGGSGQIFISVLY